MSASNTFEALVLDLLFFGTTFNGIAENDTTSPDTNFYISLHTADPGEAGDQTTSEAAYTGYSRVAVARSAAGWTRSGNSVTNDAEVAFGQCTASPANVTHFGIGPASSGAGTWLLSNALSSGTLIMQVGTTPLFSAGELEATCD